MTLIFINAQVINNVKYFESMPKILRLDFKGKFSSLSM